MRSYQRATPALGGVAGNRPIDVTGALSTIRRSAVQKEMASLGARRSVEEVPTPATVAAPVDAPRVRDNLLTLVGKVLTKSLNEAPLVEAVSVPVPETFLLFWNLGMAAFHMSFVLATVVLATPDLTVPVYRTSLQFEILLPNGTFVVQHEDEFDGVVNTTVFRLTPYYEETGKIHLTMLTVSFFLLSSLFHTLNATLLRDFYTSELSHCRTPTRWIEYSLSAPVCFVLIAYGMGVRSQGTLLASAGLVCATMPFGFWTETLARPVSGSKWASPLWVRLLPWLAGHVPQSIAWTVVLLQFYDNGWNIGRVPAFVHAILWSELVLFFSFGVASLVSQVLPPRLFWYGELGFQILSLVSKGVLGGLILGNVLMLSEFDELYRDELRST